MASEDGDDAHLVEEDGYDALLDLRPAIVQRLSEIRLSSVRVSREHFVHWDPKVFMPGRIWNSISFPPDHDITDSNIYLFICLVLCGQDIEGWGASRLERAERCMGR